MPAVVGQLAPDFTLPSTSGGDVTLSQFRGKSSVLLAFFPLAFTPVCTTEMMCFTDDLAKFQATGTMVLPISVDAIPSLKEFRVKEGLAVELLSDFKREVCRAYGTLLDERFFSRRAYFLVDRQGVLRWAHVEAELGHRREDDELLGRIAAI